MVQLQLFRRADGSGYYWYLKIGEKNRLAIEIDLERRDQTQQIGRRAGALAEEHCLRFHAGLEPSLVALTAMKAYRRLVNDPKVRAVSKG